MAGAENDTRAARDAETKWVATIVAVLGLSVVGYLAYGYLTSGPGFPRWPEEMEAEAQGKFEKDMEDREMDRITARLEGKSSTAAPATEVQLPANFPSDIPLIEGGWPVYILRDEAAGRSAVICRVNDFEAKLAEFYRQRMEAQGWRAAHIREPHVGSSLAFVKEGRVALVTTRGIGSAGRVRKSVVAIVYGER